MTVIFARLVREHAHGESQRVTHLIALPQNGTLPTELKAHCGATFPTYTLENLPEIGGAPCVSCLAAIPIPPSTLADPDAMPSLPPASRPTPHRRRPTPPSAGMVALGLREEDLVHNIPDKPLASVLDGRTVVITECGVLGWIVQTEPQTHWRRCEDCARTTPPWPSE